MTVYYTLNLGRYNFADPAKKQWCLSLHTPYGRLSETWDEDDEPDCAELLPTEVLDLIEKRLDSYWISTGREKTKAVIAEIRAHGNEVDALWLRRELENVERLIKSHESRAASIRSVIAELESEAAA